MNRPVRKIAFVSPHCVLDFTNGAATATLDALTFLQSLGFQCEAFCNSRLDSWEEVLVEEVLARRGLHYQVRNAQIGQFRGRMIFTAYGSQGALEANRRIAPDSSAMQPALTPGPSPGGRGEQLPVTIFNSASTRGAWIDREEIAAFLTACEIFLKRNRPDLVWTYGGDDVALAVQRLAKQLGIPILFALHNLAYQDAEPFRLVDRVVVPSEYARRHYRETLGLECDVLPLAVDLGRVKVAGAVPVPQRTHLAPRDVGHHAERDEYVRPPPSPLPEGEGTFVTFVNPTPLKGVFVFARIAQELSRRRPDIPLLIVEGSGKASFLPKLGIDLSGVKNLRIMPNTPDVRQVFARTKLLVMPSLMENAALLAMEAMLNGIPVLASNRGGLPETISDAGFLFEIPDRFTPETWELPTAEEVALWVETTIRLWDDAAEYERRSNAARERAQQWHSDRLAPLYREFFRSRNGDGASFGCEELSDMSDRDDKNEEGANRGEPSDDNWGHEVVKVFVFNGEAPSRGEAPYSLQAIASRQVVTRRTLRLEYDAADRLCRVQETVRSRPLPSRR
jgi:glycosyltransferase involved in cell wall biosynthesis